MADALVASLGIEEIDPTLRSRLNAELRKVKRLRPVDRRRLLPELEHAIFYARADYPYMYAVRGRRNPKKLRYYVLYYDVEQAFTKFGLKVTACRNKDYGTESVFLGVVRTCILLAGLPHVTNLEQAVIRARKTNKVTRAPVAKIGCYLLPSP